MATHLFAVALFLFCIWVFWTSRTRSKKGQFYSDTPQLFPLGIFIWGDGLVLAPFWAVASLFFFFSPPLNILRFFLLFFAVRSGFEVIYWLNQQATHSEYVAPLFRSIKWLKANDAAILMQVIQMCLSVSCIVLLWASFQYF